MDAIEKKKLKFVVIGGPNVGKTTLIHKYLNPESIIDTTPTIQLAYSNKDIEYEGRRYSLDICDTAGQERFQSICPNFYRGADGAIIVFDVTNYQTFQKVGDWLAEFSATMPDTFQTVIVGNKSDLTDQRLVSIDEAMEYASGNGTSYFDVSAKRGDCVDYAFVYLIQKCVEAANVHEMDIHDTPETVNLNEPQNSPEKQGRCC
ncbi:Ras-related protein Rab7 [Tritrichomonas foetus]|uniref:Ras-related protein Rab7 n=1 Tax=Tritrichomonas foetus TaxID=1144522 RepID=A0A1J4JK85_9EUKA|nr:Ras-related protein Rab7 [Tritrichomonas foetus]|eukprot:OHS97939.1 Ras-related protein Rab7 [Tritrichomonas foetus]